MTSLAAPSRAAFGSSAVHTARLKTPQRCPLALPETSRPKARASKGQTPPPSARSSASSFKTTIARASRDALSSSLSDEEQGALDAFVASGGDVAKAKALMVEAATTKKVDGDLLLGALALLLSRGDAASGADALTAADVDGSWELPWASVAPIKRWRYIPVPEFFDVALGQKCGLRSNVGPLHFEFWGPMEEGAADGGEGGEGGKGWDALNQAVTFQFTHQKIGWGSTESPFVDKELSKNKGDRVYRFFAFQRDEGVVGARSSGGPLVLLRKASK